MITRLFTKRYISLLFLLISSSVAFSQSRWRLQFEAGIPYSYSKLWNRHESNFGISFGNLGLSYGFAKKSNSNFRRHEFTFNTQLIGSHIAPLAYSFLKKDHNPYADWPKRAANEAELFGIQYLISSSSKVSHGIKLSYNHYLPEDNPFPFKIVIGLVRNQSAQIEKNLHFGLQSEVFRSIVTPGTPIGGPIFTNIAGISLEPSLSIGSRRKHSLYFKLRYMQVLKLHSFLTFTPDYLYRLELGYRFSISC